MEYKVTFEEIKRLLLPFDKSLKYYGIPRGGMYLAAMLNPVNTPEEADVIIDDLIDSGKTIKKWAVKYPDKQIAILINKNDPKYKDKWIVFPWEEEGTKEIEDVIVRQLEFIGENPNREGLIETPKRVVKMWLELFAGYQECNKPKVTTFMNGLDGIAYNQMILDSGDFYSLCEHHMLPFYGKYFFSYIPSPKGKILGLSKVARVVNYYAAKLQIQERLGSDIVEELLKAITGEGVEEPLGIAIVLKAEHLCKSMRGVKKKGIMTTAYLKGRFADSLECREEFLKHISSTI
jgi:GTP cyclohydrolase I